jgi:hypothetical protein
MLCCAYRISNPGILMVQSAQDPLIEAQMRRIASLPLLALPRHDERSIELTASPRIVLLCYRGEMRKGWP